MLRILIVGFGDVAERLAKQLLGRRGVRLYALVRRPERFDVIRGLGVTPLLGDLDSLARLRRLWGQFDAVVHLAPPPNQGETDPRTRRLLTRLGTQRLCNVYVSTTGVYGDCQGARIDETHPINPHSARARRRVDAERQLRRATNRGEPWAVLRAPGIYALERLPIDRIKARTPSLINAEDNYSNHIHADDLARLCWLALFRGKPGRVVNACDGIDMKMGDYFDAVADAYELPRPPRLSRAEVKAAVSPMLWSFMQESRRIGNARLRREIRFKLGYQSPIELLARVVRNPKGAARVVLD